MTETLNMLIVALILSMILLYSLAEKIYRMHKRIIELESIASLCSEEMAKYYNEAENWRMEYEKAKLFPESESEIAQRLKSENDMLYDDIVRLSEELDKLKASSAAHQN